MRKFAVASICVSLLISWQIWQGDSGNAGGYSKKHKDKKFKCDLAGTWRAGSSFNTIVPLDSKGHKFAFVAGDPIPQDATIFGYYPTAVALTPTHGIFVKKSRNLFGVTVSQIPVDEMGNKLGELVVSGKTKFIDCDHRVSTITIQLLDANGEEILCFPDTGQVERYKLAPPCPGLLRFPEFERVEYD